MQIQFVLFQINGWLPQLNIEYIDRDALSTTRKISGPSQKRSSDWIVALKNSSFKKLLIEFLVKSLKDDSLVAFFSGKVSYANRKGTCYKFELHNVRVLRNEQVNYCDHEGADNLISLIVSCNSE